MSRQRNARLLLWLPTVVLIPLGIVLFLYSSTHPLVSGNVEAATPKIAVRKGQLMTLDPTRKFLINSNTMKPVFIVGEDAWSLVIQIPDEDVQLYLNDRAARGYNAIWVGLADNTFSDNPPRDIYGNVPFSGPDFTNENPAYWARVDKIVSWAAARGITVFASPAFSGYGCKGGYCESYRKSSERTLTEYGKFLGQRYTSYPNIVWVIGGDADPSDANVESKLQALAKGIKATDTEHLMTGESYRGTSAADQWGKSSWLDLNAVYSLPVEIPARSLQAYRSGKFPPLLFEDWYEGDHSMTDFDIREEGYWAVLSGCTLGRFFGNNAIWNFSTKSMTQEPWKTQLGSPGSVSQEWLGKLFQSREHWKLVPDDRHTVMTAGYDQTPLLSLAKESIRSVWYRDVIRAKPTLSVTARTSDGQTIIAYIPTGNATTVSMDMSSIRDSHSMALAWWFNPRTGSNSFIGTLPAKDTHTFTPPDSNDWVLVIDSKDANLGAPGQKAL